MQHRSDAGRDARVAPPPTGHVNDEPHMRRALALAERGRGTTSPNPMVGCVIVHGDEVVGEGWHQRPGEAHAEVHALRAAADRARGATVFVTLEPCDHHGRTPPCTEALLAAGVARVVVATLDPNPAVQGQGVARLRAAGVEVGVGLLESEARTLNAPYLTLQTRGRPWVRYKAAMTLDGKIATRTGHSRWITGETSRALVQRWRHESDAVAVGISTVLLDDPRLTARVPDGRSPRKVVFDSVARTPVQAVLFEPDDTGAPARVTIMVGPTAPAARVEALRARGAEVVVSDDGRGRPDVGAALTHLAGLGVTSLLLEGGGTLAWSFIATRAIDRVAYFIGPMLLGGTGASPLGGMGVASIDEAIRLEGLSVERRGDDLLVEGDLRYPEAPTAPAGDDSGAAGAARPTSDERSP